MSQAFPLSLIIQKTNCRASSDIDDPAQRLVVFDTKQKRVLPKMPPLGRRRNVQCYRVSTANTVTYDVPDIRVQSVRHKVDLTVKYQARCLPDGVDRMVKALHNAEHPGAALDRLVRRWVTFDFIVKRTKGEEDFIFNHYPYHDLCVFIQEQAATEAGFRLQAEIQVRGDDQLGPKEVDTTVSVRLNDYKDSLTLRINTQLGIHSEHRIKALLDDRPATEFEELVRQHVAQTMLVENVSLHELFFQTGVVRQKLKGTLDRVFQSRGRAVTFLTVEVVDEMRLPGEHLEDEVDVLCDLKDARDVKINNRFRLSLDDLGVFKDAGIDDLKTWTKEAITEITKNIIYGLEYVDLILDFGPTEQKILSAVRKAVRRIGYSVKQHIVLPDLKILDMYRKGFDIEAQGSFVTRDPNIKVDLQIIATGRLGDLRAIKEYLKPDVDLEEQIKAVARTEVRRRLHKVSPDVFYMHFDEEIQARKRSIQQQLIQDISKALGEQFYTKDLNLTLKQPDTALIERFKKLQERTHTFKVDATSLRDSEHTETVTYVVPFRITSVDKNSWYTFQSRSFDSVEDEIERIKDLLDTDIRAKLDTLYGRSLRYQDYDNLQKIEQLMNLSGATVIEHFGLMVKIGPIRRMMTKTEKGKNDELVLGIEKGVNMDQLLHGRLAEDQLQRLDQLLKERLDLDPVEAEAREALKRQIDEVLAEKVYHTQGEGKTRFMLPESANTEQDELDAFLLPPASNEASGADHQDDTT